MRAPNPARIGDTFSQPHLRVDAAIAVGDAEETALSPARAPAVLADPAAIGIVVPDHAHAMAAGKGSGDVPVNPSGVVEEVVVHGEAGGDRSSR